MTLYLWVKVARQSGYYTVTNKRQQQRLSAPIAPETPLKV